MRTKYPRICSSSCLLSINFHNTPHFVGLNSVFFVYSLYSNKLFVDGAPVKRVPTENRASADTLIRWNSLYGLNVCKDTVSMSLLGEITATEKDNELKEL